MASEAQEKERRIVLAPEPSAKKALPGTKADAFGLKAFGEQRRAVETLGQGDPDEHAAIGFGPADAFWHVAGKRRQHGVAPAPGRWP